MLQTPLYAQHQALGAKLVPFSGWLMPLQYTSITEEHLTTRSHAGLFDVSHMGRLDIIGDDAMRFVDYVATNKMSNKQSGSCTYTVFCHENGTCVDDALIFMHSPEHFSIIVNAGNREKDLHHLKSYASRFSISINSYYDTDGILALQGPQSTAIVEAFFPEIQSIKPMKFITLSYRGSTIILSRTGYTGEIGYELYAPFEIIVEMWGHFLGQGAKPVGLGARDTLRLEMGYALYGHELSDAIFATESIAAWTVKFDKEDFLGKHALHSTPATKRAVGLEIIDKGIAREGMSVFDGDKKIGYVTSGTFSPTLKKAIALAIVDAKNSPGDSIQVVIRDRRVVATICDIPFLNKRN